MKNYNIQLMKALHSYFWYEGLLEETDKYVSFDHNGNQVADTDDPNYYFSRPAYTDDCMIMMLIRLLRRETDMSFTKETAATILGQHGLQNDFSMLWQILVDMFGNYGTSPRSGWIERCNDCADFLEDIVYIEERSLRKVDR